MAMAHARSTVTSTTSRAAGDGLPAVAKPIGRSTQPVMSASFGRDFSGLRVHSAGQATHEPPRITPSRGAVVLRRQACGHDGRQPECGGHRWGLVNVTTGAATNEDLDHRIVELGLRGNFGGTWATQVQTPPNKVKGGVSSGRVDGLRVMTEGGLRVEVVEVKSRGTQFNGGCARATREAAEYVRLLNGLAPHIVTISRVLSAHPELRAAGEPNAAQRRALAANQVHLDRPEVRQAWNFFRSLETRLGHRFGEPFSTFSAGLYADAQAVPETSYPAGPAVMVDCTKRGKAGVRARQLMFQVNGQGGVSYGCTNTDCEVSEEQEERERSAEARSPAVPVLVGVGAAAATGVGLAAARRRAATIAARRLAIEAAQREAARRAGQAAWRQTAEAAAARRAARAAAAGAGRRVAARAASRVVGIASAAAAVLVLASGEARAEIGPGQSSLEALYELMTRNGTPPSPEMRELIENDPVLRQLAERAARTGDASGLQRELDRQSLEFLREHAHELSDEDLDILLSSANARGAGGTPPASVEQLRAAIAAERARPGTGTPAREQNAATRAGGAGPRAVSGSGPGVAQPERQPRLSAEVRGELAAASAARRRVVEALISGRAGGPRVTDDSVRRILAAVPADLTAAQANRLVERVGPAAGRSVDEIVESVRGAVRGDRQQAVHGAEPGETTAGAQSTRAEYVRSIIDYIDAYPGWGQVGAGTFFAMPISRGTDPAVVPVGTPFEVIMVGRTFHSPPVRFAGTGQVAVVRRTANTVTLELRTNFTEVREDRRTFTIPAGRRYENSRLVGVQR